VGFEVTLVPMAVARFVLGCETEAVVERVESGRLLWVWDFAAPGSRYRRDLRFLATELRSLPEGLPPATPGDVIRRVIGPTPNGFQRSALIEVRWTISPQHVRNLCDAGLLNGPIEGRGRRLSGRSMEAFLLQRLVR
jgi:hypothetical protein